MSSPRRFAALLILTSSACAHSPGPAATAPPSRSASEPTHTPHVDAPTPPLVLPPDGLVDAGLFAELMGYDPRLSTTHPAANRVSFFEALELANRLSERSAMAACYTLRCDGPATMGCAREGQPYCEDVRKCTASRNPEPCGYRLPTTGGGDGELAVWLEPEPFNADCLVGGRTRLSSLDTAPDRRAPTHCALRADHIGIRLLAPPGNAASPSESGAKP